MLRRYLGRPIPSLVCNTTDVMTAEQPDWQELDRELTLLLDLEPEEQQSRLAALAEQNPALASKLKTMLASAQACAPLLDLGHSDLAAHALDERKSASVPDHIGPWKLLEPVGEGGMAEVYKAEREIADSAQIAALKLLADTYRDDAALQRFKQETGILAKLVDPRIARLIDAGVTESGRPWLAMEYIEGEHVHDGSDALELGLKDRVTLMREIARAVAYAHQHLVVHCDLKPSNILLDQEQRVRLLDFGIATVFDHSDRPERERAQQLAYTFRYASPEQLRGEALTTASDIFQLGVVCYQLITGANPFGEEKVASIERLELLQRGPLPISSQQASAPSNKRKLIRACNADLERIIAKALAFSPTDRYASANAFANDLTNWLEHRPVAAHPGGSMYRLRKFLRRNWIANAVVGLGIAVLAAYLVLALQHNRQLQVERDAARAAQARSESMHDYLLEVLGTVDPQMQASRGKSADQLLTEAVAQAEREFADEPLLAAEVLLDLAEVLKRRGMLKDAIHAYEKVLDIRSEIMGERDESTLVVMRGLAETYHHNHEFDKAQALSSEHLEAARSVYGEKSFEYIVALYAAAPIVSRTESPEAALELVKQAISTYEQLYGKSGPPTDYPTLEWELLHQLAVLYSRERKFDRSEPVLAHVVENYRRELTEADYRTQQAITNWAFALRYLKRQQEAQVILEQLLSAQRELYGRAHWRTAYTLGHLANLASDLKDYPKSIELWRQSEQEMIAASGPDHPWIISAQSSAAQIMLRAGQCEAESILRSIRDDETLDPVISQRAEAALEQFGCDSESQPTE